MQCEIPRTDSTPLVIIDEAKGYMRFEGESYSENVIEFYKVVTEWLNRYLKTDFNVLVFDCSLEYFNSSTSKLLYNILTDMDNTAAKGKDIVINWYADKDNDIIIESGEDFEEDLENLIFKLIIKE
jgi:hypothetical protein